MAKPALRPPKIVTNHEKTLKSVPRDKNYVIVTLKGERKLVVTADSYNGILSMGGIYKCVFCGTLLDLQQAAKEKHVLSINHCRILEKYPHADEFSHNLIRKLTDDNTYCTICNVIVANVKLMKHICSEVHLQELERASTRALTYKAHE